MDYKIAICDDEQQFQSLAEDYLEKAAKRCGQSIVLRFFKNGRECLDAIPKDKPDLLLLDIDMPDLDGLAVAKQIREKDQELLIAFLTSHEEYVFQSFEVQPFRFIRKSQMEMELFLALRAALAIKKPKRKNLIVLQQKNGEEKVDTAELMYMVLEMRKMSFYQTKERITKTRMTMKELLEQLEGDERFVQINSGTVVNVDYVERYTNENVILKNRMELKIARPRKEMVRAAILKNWEKR